MPALGQKRTLRCIHLSALLCPLCAMCGRLRVGKEISNLGGQKRFEDHFEVEREKLVQ
jgi:hypothetical protein